MGAIGGFLLAKNSHENHDLEEAQRETRLHVEWLAKTVAKIGASVETDPSVRPVRPGCAILSRSELRVIGIVIAP